MVDRVVSGVALFLVGVSAGTALTEVYRLIDLMIRGS
jgi:hypothetical protein